MGYLYAVAVPRVELFGNDGLSVFGWAVRGMHPPPYVKIHLFILTMTYRVHSSPQYIMYMGHGIGAMRSAGVVVFSILARC